MAKKAFTLVELIVVITIVAILGTISFVSFQWYSQSAADSKTVSDISNTHKKIALFKVESWFVPKPDNSVNVYAWSGNVITFQWEIGKSVKSILDIWYKLEDNSGKNYKYSTNWKQKLYTLIWYLEAPYSSLSHQIFADDFSTKYLYFKGDDIVTLFDEKNEYVSDDILDIKKEKIIAYLGKIEKEQKSDDSSWKNIVENIPEEIINNTVVVSPTPPTPSNLSCDAGSITGTNGTYPYSAIAHDANTSSVIDVNVANGTQEYTATISCNNGITSITSETANAITCNTHYQLNWSICSKIAYNSCKEIHTRYPQLWDGEYFINPTGVQEISVTCDMANGGWTKYLDIKWTYSQESARSCFDWDLVKNSELYCINPWKHKISGTEVKNILHQNVNLVSADALTGKEYYFPVNSSTDPVWKDGHSSRSCYWNNDYFSAMYAFWERNYTKEGIRRVRFGKNFCLNNNGAARQQWGISMWDASSQYMNYSSTHSSNHGPQPGNRESTAKKMSFWIR